MPEPQIETQLMPTQVLRGSLTDHIIDPAGVIRLAPVGVVGHEQAKGDLVEAVKKSFARHGHDISDDDLYDDIEAEFFRIGEERKRVAKA